MQTLIIKKTVFDFFFNGKQHWPNYDPNRRNHPLRIDPRPLLQFLFLHIIIGKADVGQYFFFSSFMIKIETSIFVKVVLCTRGNLLSANFYIRNFLSYFVYGPSANSWDATLTSLTAG